MWYRIISDRWTILEIAENIKTKNLKYLAIIRPRTIHDS